MILSGCFVRFSRFSSGAVAQVLRSSGKLLSLEYRNELFVRL